MFIFDEVPVALWDDQGQEEVLCEIPKVIKICQSC